jgi:membrane protein insertase Oxa1/YidC/SpoIIIJ
MVDARGLLCTLVQAPVVIGMYSAVRRAMRAATGGRFLWIPNITRPDVVLATLVAALTGVAMALAPHARAQPTRLLLLMPAALTFLVLMKMSAAYGLYWGASSVVSTVQALLLRRQRVTG